MIINISAYNNYTYRLRTGMIETLNWYESQSREKPDFSTEDYIYNSNKSKWEKMSNQSELFFLIFRSLPVIS